MAEPFLSQLRLLVSKLVQPSPENVNLESKHFFSGAALYANGKICASLSPAGFAVKLPTQMRQNLSDEDQGSIFRFFANGPIKREYVLLSDAVIEDEELLLTIIGASIIFVAGEQQ